ncbi:MAG: hypothetical protein AB1486_24000, partial [Planctomycetota bacterium]
MLCKVLRVRPRAAAPRAPGGRPRLVMIVNTYHHLDNRPVYLARLKQLLRRSGSLVVIDYHKEELPVGPPPAHKLAREEVVSEVEAAGFTLCVEHDTLKYQYFLVFGLGDGAGEEPPR